ncbi:MAG: PIN domain-containing protein [Bacteroidota bacterium]|nr:PIN domain-containing protein [Bacteroidota bacterium]MDP4232949.1 PIN domain-containing protein [Bacteroidota bacterium]MDP4241993.1 PIN domain-containing protein [Bacteroidota bacterium]MDP4286896.1 PIN domain-containing protein [Bacteroidota bacterium]
MVATIDLNVILDIYLLRGDFDSSMAVLSLCRRWKVSGNIPSHAAPTIYYILKKSLGISKARELSGQLLDVLEIVPVNKAMLTEARNSAIADFEDAIVEAAAHAASSTFIITSNVRDFASGRIPAITSSEFLLQFS